MCLGGGSSPDTPAQIPEAPVTPDPTSGGAADSDAARRRRAAGTTGTILTGPRGITDGAATGPKTLLGQ